MSVGSKVLGLRTNKDYFKKIKGPYNEYMGLKITTKLLKLWIQIIHISLKSIFIFLNFK